jgi:WD40 repeat protein
MMKDDRAHLQLFDLIAREWHLPAPARQITFNADATAVAFACEDGGIHLAATADKDSPTRRTRRAIDTARLTIAPREKPYPPLKPADFTLGRTSDVVAFGSNGFAFAKETGRINSLTPGGIAVHLAARAPAEIAVLAASPDGRTLAYASGATVHVATADASATALPAASLVRALAFSPDGTVLAVAYAQGVARWDLRAPDKPPVETPLAGLPVSLNWHPDGSWLSVGLGDGGFCLLDTAANTATHHGNFRAPVRRAVFGRASNTVLAAGAFRVAAWDLADRQAVLTGRPGLVLVTALATSPDRNLVAVGYANGLLSLAEISRPSEILLREDTGAGITAMEWSSNGSYLALAGSDGSAALVEFPDSMFKS